MGHPRIAQHVISRGRRTLGRGGTRINPTMSLRKVAMRYFDIVSAYFLVYKGYFVIVFIKVILLLVNFYRTIRDMNAYFIIYALFSYL
jgi:hypothetical protein